MKDAKQWQWAELCRSDESRSEGAQRKQEIGSEITLSVGIFARGVISTFGGAQGHMHKHGLNSIDRIARVLPHQPFWTRMDEPTWVP